MHAAFESNGLASQLARQGAHWTVQIAQALRHSLAALLDVTSVRAWWADLMDNPQHRAELGGIALALIGALIPALALEWLTRRLLRKAIFALGARHVIDPYDLFFNEPSQPESEPAAESTGTVATAATAATTPAKQTAAHSGTAPKTTTPSASTEATGRWHAARHWSLLRRLPRAGLRMLAQFVPLIVFVGAASLLMSVFTTDGTPQDRATDSIIDIYVLSRVIVIVCGFFLQPDAPRLRLLQIGDVWAAFTQRWVVMIVSVVGAGSACAEIALALGLSDDAHLAFMKVVALVAHVMVVLVIVQCRTPVAARIRKRFAASPSLAMFGNSVADSWAAVSIFLVMALWFVWALDVRNGYHTLVHLGGISIAVLVGARLISIVVLGALARVFEVRDGDPDDSLVHQHAYRYYPLVRRVVSWFIGAITVLTLMQVWGANVVVLFGYGTIGHRLASALITIAVAAVVALFVWETVNVVVERRLHQWTTAGDMVRAARLRTLLPMLRSALFVVIALIVVLTGLSELGVNIGPLLAGASIFGVALGFGSQKLVQDFITGMFLLMENAMQVGDWVTLAGVSGTVEYLSIRTVRLRGGDGSLYTVPFSSVSTVNNTNRGLGNAAVKVSITYGEDVERASATLKEIGAALREDPQFKDGILSDFAFWGVDSVDGASITLTGQIQCRDSGRWGVQREFNRRVAQLFQERGIAIANPQRTVLIRGGNGGAAQDEGEPVAASTPEARADAASGLKAESGAASGLEAESGATFGLEAEPAANQPPVPEAEKPPVSKGSTGKPTAG